MTHVMQKMAEGWTLRAIGGRIYAVDPKGRVRHGVTEDTLHRLITRRAAGSITGGTYGLRPRRPARPKR